MKKLFILFITFLLTLSTVFASQILRVKAVTPISTKNPTKNISVLVLENVVYKNFNFAKGDILYGEMINVIQPRKMGKNATFSFKITSYEDLKNVEHALSEPITINYRQQLKPNFERSEFSSGNLCFSPYDVTLMKESKSVGDFIIKDTFKDSFWQPGWQIEIKTG